MFLDQTMFKLAMTRFEDVPRADFQPALFDNRRSRKQFGPVRVALRHASRDQGQAESVFRAGELEVDLAARVVKLDGKEIHLTPIEYKLLATLIVHADKVVTHGQLLRKVWGPNAELENQYLRVYMNQLRKKLEPEPAMPKFLLTEPGVGYRLKG